ncbi:MAG: hypothetical protein A2275_13195 [Bacteroidetes bacterium RIFOXYA12_FULL_35_11]|nr:MAG: hypothetical protein A2X01_11570 [Bacteroidetes bacterium GWF2_35_48]OFY72675.1 MAG: hypothetical protein A2275_13195 [Bacteroidetes bacterium RIFOXYA12_FULL_35_11]OFY97399.1 MAG: hypothetical protein A2309_03450 [Bacteroidetes bacterium RIFOXYB2_FULL_35_7]
MNNLLTRTFTGALFALVLIGGIWFSRESFLIISLAIVSLGLWEFYSVCKNETIFPQKILGIASGVYLLASNFSFASGLTGPKIILPIIGFIFLIFVFELYRKKTQPFTNIAITLLGILWIALPVSLMNYIVLTPTQEISYTPWILLGFFFLIWANDTGAYLFGITLGKHRLFERVSPKKSWEGSIGGAFVTFGVAYMISHFYTEISFFDWLIVSVIVIICGTFGDLVESLFKRSINIKDSGNILPGHGGILDRFDSAFLAAPCVFMYLELIK